MKFVHLIAESSIGVWLPYFMDTDNEAAFVMPSGAATSNAMSEFLETVLPSSNDTACFIHSGHSSFQRDLELARILTESQRRVVAASPCAVAYALDKVSMKELFLKHGIETPPSLELGNPVSEQLTQCADWVVKTKNGTAGAGIIYYPAGTLASAPANAVTERFIDGEEYSVNVFSLAGHKIVFPPVWKGQTSRQMLHPAKRLRICPAPSLPKRQADLMTEQACELVDLLQTEGFSEVEFVLSDVPLVLEINPRISGTLRLSLLASGTTTLLELIQSKSARLDVRHVSVEVPFSGPSFVDREAGVFGTSRLTTSGSTFLSALDKLAPYLSEPDFLKARTTLQQMELSHGN